jgi:hypothetical protein
MNAELLNIQQFFTERRLRCLSVKSIEMEAKLPAKTLSHFLKGRRKLNETHIKNLIPILNDFGFCSNNSFICPCCGSDKTYNTEAIHCTRCAVTTEL